MTEQNPYQAPDANLTEGRKSADVELAVTGIKSLPASAGVTWIKDAFNLFKMNPLIWIVLIILWFVLNIVVQLVPVIGGLAMSLLYAVFMAGFMIGCAALERGENLEVGHLFAGFKNNTGSLIGLGAVYLGIIIAFAVVFGVLVFGGMGGIGALSDPESINPTAIFTSGIMFTVLIALLLMIPIMMMFWFAPALISLGGVPLIESLKMSFSGCLKNILPMFVFGLIMIVLAIVASIPFFLGWLVLMPMGMAAFYTAYRSIYTD
ncbi:MAG: BPSS1780 family membrane protein [Gammaproteobacteria bacterium]